MNMELYRINEVYSHRYYKIPKDLFENSGYKYTLNSDAKLLYALLLDRMELSRENGWVNSKGEIYLIFTRDELCEMLGLCRNTMTKAFRQLSAAGLIYEKRRGRGLPNLIFIGKIKQDVTFDRETVNKDVSCERQWVADKVSGEFSDSRNLRIKKRKKCDSRSVDYANQEAQNLRPNETDINKTDKNESVSGNEEDINGQTDNFSVSIKTDIEILDSIVESCELQIFDDENLRLVFRHCLETMYFSEYLKVGSAKIPQSIVRSRMQSLNGAILAYALGKIKDCTGNMGEIKNSTNYMISAIWNGISEYHSDVEVSPELNRNMECDRQRDGPDFKADMYYENSQEGDE
jgi:hypothetical protein